MEKIGEIDFKYGNLVIFDPRRYPMETKELNSEIANVDNHIKAEDKQAHKLILEGKAIIIKAGRGHGGTYPVYATFKDHKRWGKIVKEVKIVFEPDNE